MIPSRVVHPPVAYTTQPRSQVATKLSICYSYRPTMDMQSKVGYQALTEMAVKEHVISPRDNLFRPRRRAGRGMLGKPHWAVNVFRVPSSLDPCTWSFGPVGQLMQVIYTFGITEAPLLCKSL
jgi:hypothetical protein